MASFRIAGYRSQRHVEDDVFAVGAGSQGVTSRFARLGNDVFPVFQVQEGPQLAVAAHDDMSSTAAVSAVGSALGRHLVAVKMHRACAAGSGAAADLHVINKVG